MTVSVGLIGCGNISRSHLRGYLAVPGQAIVTAVTDVDPDAARERARQAGGAQAFDSYERMLAEADIDAVDICLPHHLHAAAVIAAAEAGKHILCEKPLCLTLDEADRIADAVNSAGVTLMCAHNQLTLPAVAHARDLIDSGALGRVYELRTTDSFFNDFDPSTMGWRAHAATSGGGELIDTGYHPTYLLLYLASARPAAVTAMLSTHRLTFMEGEDSARVLVRFADGAVGEVVTSWAYEAAPHTEKFSVVGENGSLWSDGTTLHHKVRGGATTMIDCAVIDSHAAVCTDFIHRIRDRTRPVHTHEEGTDVLKVILAAYQSAQQKQEISL
ncbi:Gfo/Idh/MocA family protein [Streptomyces sp. NPDC102274]|uniref:Gfo/Idh/MocA family protein n=1 Tax=Streptomyces sp. NPDC102274 TaxID=3366151 RepID=UPI00380DA25D